MIFKLVGQRSCIKMLNGQKNNNRLDEFSGLALALLFDSCFVDLFDFSESSNKPLRRLRPRQSLLAKRHDLQVPNKEIFLGRF